MLAPEQLLTSVFAAAFEAVAGEHVDPLVRRSRFRTGRLADAPPGLIRADFQIDAALPLARRLRRAPRDVAVDVVREADLSGIGVAEVSGPGFINVTLDDAMIAGLVSEVLGDPRLGVPITSDAERIVIDYSGPNVAKEMHVGHLRSTVIGDAAARLCTWLGHDVHRVNHVGDWGTPFGMLIEHLLDLGETEAAHELSIGDLGAFYQGARAKFDTEPAFVERSRLRVVALQSGDPETRRLWDLLVAESERYFLAVYDTLGVTLTAADFQGESSHNADLLPVVEELSALGLVRDSDGAACVFPTGFTGRDGEPLPLILRKGDGGFGYPATDLAAIRHRLVRLKADRLLYVIGEPQRLHMEMVFQVAREAGWLTTQDVSFVGFGLVLGADGSKLASRAGDSVKLASLLEESVARASLIGGASVAPAVGIGAIKYADLSHDRNRNYTFDWDRMLATTGDTAAYLQYTHARIRSITRKAAAADQPAHDRPGHDRPAHDRHGSQRSVVSDGASGHGSQQTVPGVAGAGMGELAGVVLTHPAERALALELLGFAPVLSEVAETLLFHRITGYLQGLASAYTSFYDTCPVLKSDGELRASRLALCDLTARTIARGLDLLGIEAPDAM